MARLCVWVWACVITCWFTSFAVGQEIVMVAKHVCSKAENNRLKFEINLYDQNRLSTHLKALNLSDSEIDTCGYSGTGRFESPYRVVSYVDRSSNVEDNGCGIRTFTVNNEVFYSWHLRASRNISGTNILYQGYIVNATCSRDNITDGDVQTQVRFNITTFFVAARFPENITGQNTFGTGSDLILTAVFYPNGINVPPGLSNAKGIYPRNCVSATDPTFTQNRQLFVDQFGCPVAGATFEPSNAPQKRAGTGSSPIIVDIQFFNAAKVGNLSTIYVQCGVGKCTLENDVGCINFCLSNQPNQTSSPSGVDSGEQFSTNFNVQDVAAQQLIAATSADQTTPVEAITVGNSVVLVSRHSPFGTAGSVPIDPLLRSAKGFYIHSCRYSEDSTFTLFVQFINSSGCIIPGTLLSPESEFMFTSLINNVYTITSGQISPQVPTFRRVWVRCNTGICTQENHNYCGTRCGAVDNIPGAARNLGYNGMEFTLTITNASTPAVDLTLSDSTGQTVAGEAIVNIGDALTLSIVVNPAGTGPGSGVFNGVKGIFVRDCFVTENPDLNSVTEAEKVYFIDTNGCRIEDSPYRTSQNCVMENAVPGVPPFVVNCGTFSSPTSGTFHQFCGFGACTTENNINCLDRCAAGVLNPGENAVNLDSSFSRQFQVVARDDRRTAIRANEIATTIITVTVVAPCVVVLAVCIITYFVIRYQRRKSV